MMASLFFLLGAFAVTQDHAAQTHAKYLDGEDVDNLPSPYGDNEPVDVPSDLDDLPGDASFMEIGDEVSTEDLKGLLRESLLEVQNTLQQQVDKMTILQAVLSSFAEIAQERQEAREEEHTVGQKEEFKSFYTHVLDKLGDLKERAEPESLIENIKEATTTASNILMQSAGQMEEDEEDETATAHHAEGESLMEGQANAAKVQELEKKYNSDFANAFKGEFEKGMKKDHATEPKTDAFIETGDKDQADPFAKVKQEEDAIRKEMKNVFDPTTLAASFADTKASVAVDATGKTTNLRNEK